MYQLIISDLDGTLLTPEHIIAPYTQQVLASLVQQDRHFVFASGRHHLDVSAIRRGIGIAAYMITSNGARIHDFNERVIFKADVPTDVVKQVAEMVVDDNHVTMHLFTDDGWFSSKENEGVEIYNQLSGFTYTRFNKAQPPAENVAKLSLSHPEHRYLLRYETLFLEAFSERVNIAFSSPNCLDITSFGANKGTALATVADLLNVPMANTLAFGDAMNDKEMLEKAGKGLIMATGQERLKQTLSGHEVIGSCADEAVACYISDNV